MKKAVTTFLEKIKGRELVMLAVLVIGLGIVVIQVGRKQLFRNNAAGGNSTIVLTSNPSPLGTVSIGNNFTVNVALTPGSGESVVGADVLLSFNPAVLSVASITIPAAFPTGQNLQTYAPTNANGSFNSASVIASANSTGTLAMSAVAFNWTGNVTTAAQTTAVPNFATITFHALTAGNTNIQVVWTGSGVTTDSNLVSIASGTPLDIISDSTGTALNSKVAVTVGSGITPTAIPPTATPTVIVPTHTPTPVPTSTPIPSATPVPTLVPSISPTAGPSATPTIAGSPTPSAAQGDANHDGRVDGLDYIAWLNGYRLYNGTQTNQGPTVGDFNSTGFVDGLDYIIWRNNYGRF